MKLFEYQIENKNALLETLNEPDKIHTFVSQMSSGKTAISCSLIADIWEMNQINEKKIRVWVIVNRIELLTQWKAELKKFAPKVWSVGEISADRKFYKAAVTVVQIQTLRRYLDKIDPALQPNLVLYDEAHETAFEKIANKLTQKFKFKQINLTATPVRHGGSAVQYEDLFPRENWIMGATSKYLISIGRWKKPDWRLASSKLAAKTADAFGGMAVRNGDYDDTSQASVMIRLLPDHLEEWKANGGDRHSCVWFCVNHDHVLKTQEALLKIGRTSAIVTGKSTPTEREKAVQDFKKGLVSDLINCQCLTTGFDAPIASCAVWLRRTMSIGLFCQMTGRVLRKHEANEFGLLIDLACNLALHPFPEDIDWVEYDASKKVFRDPTMVICKKCGHRHSSIPAPLPPSKEWQWKTSQAVFVGAEDTTLEHDLSTPLVCHDCRSEVYFDGYLLRSYAGWLSSVKSAAMGSKRIPKHTKEFAGVSIGDRSAYGSGAELQVLTPKILYDFDVWQHKDLPMGRDLFKDKKEQFEKIYQGALERVDDRVLRNEKISLLSETARNHIELHPLSSVRKMDSPVHRYSTALLYCYVENKTPISALSYYGVDGFPDKSVAVKVIEKICDSDRSKALCWQWLTDWYDHHKQYRDHAKAGVINKWIKDLF